MPKSYKVCPVRVFDRSAFSGQPVVIDQQPPLPGMDEIATTRVRAATGSPGLEDFSQYIIEHDRVVKMPGRYGSVRFPEFTYTGVISGYHSSSRNLLLLSGKKADVLSFCALTVKTKSVQIDTLEIDMNALQAKLPSVNLVWFKFKTGMIRASALMGANVERTEAFVQAKSEGDISTLSFYFEDQFGEKHPIMIVNDGTVVLQGMYQEVGMELGLVTKIYDALLREISQRVSPLTRRSSGITLTPP